MGRFQFSDDHLVPALIFIVLAALACVTPAQNDTWWHLRSGQQMWQTGAFLVTEPFSHTAYGASLNNHWWLSQLTFYGVYALGGPVLLTLFAGACALAAVAGSWLLMRGPWELRTGLLAWLVVVTVPEWSIRPQVISLALLVLMAHLVARNRLAWLPLVCVVWANAHAMVVFGVVMGGAVLLEALLWSRHDVKRAAAVAAGCVLAPVLTPPGWNYWPQILATVSVSRELQIQEYQMPLRVADLPFWAGAAALVAVAFLQRHKLRHFERSDRTLLIGAAVLAVAAATAGRNIAFFAVIAAPAISRVWPSASAVPRRTTKPAGAGAWVVAVLALLVGGVAVTAGWRGNGATLGWHPMSPATVDAVRRCPDGLFNPMVDGGFLMWTLPERRVFVDSRMEAYPLELLRASRQADLRGEYAELFRAHDVNCAVVAAGSPMYDRLAADAEMTLTHSDAGHAVFVRNSRQ